MLYPTVIFLVIILCSYAFVWAFFHNYLEIRLFAQLENSVLGKIIKMAFFEEFPCVFARTMYKYLWNIRC